MTNSEFLDYWELRGKDAGNSRIQFTKEDFLRLFRLADISPKEREAQDFTLLGNTAWLLATAARDDIAYRIDKVFK